MPIGSEEYTHQMNDIANTSQVLETFNQAASPTPMDILVDRNTKWTKLTYPPHPPRDYSTPRYPTDYQPRTMCAP